MEKGGGNLNDKDIYKVAEFMAEGDIAAFSSMTQSSFTVYKIIANIHLILHLIIQKTVHLIPCFIILLLLSLFSNCFMIFLLYLK